MAQENYTLITGASSGIGYELAKLFAAIDHNLILVGRDAVELDKVRSRLQDLTRGNVVVLVKDLFNTDSPKEIYREVSENGWHVNVLVNDAGQGQYGLFAESDLDRYLDIIHLNVFALTALTRLFLTNMIARNEGRILNLASIASQTPGPWQAVYHATKAYVLSLSEALVSELKDTRVVVTALQPGVTNTDFFNKADMQQSKAVQDPSSMADPATVAKDGFDALMQEKDKVISGFRNKIQMAISGLLPDSVVAGQVAKQQEPAE